MREMVLPRKWKALGWLNSGSQNGSNDAQGPTPVVRSAPKRYCQGLLNNLAEKLARRARDAGALAAAAGNLAKAERARDAEDDANVKARVPAAVVREMGLAAPPAGSKSRDELADPLFHAVSAHSLARVELLSEGLRALLQEAYFRSENDAGAYARDWRREIAINGKRGLADESTLRSWSGCSSTSATTTWSAQTGPGRTSGNS